ncbi:Uncharacterised protein [Serratia quinivorans]|uniref:phage tail-collar fiber domain-containing protein n=1 Tax=Serratia quinivorans TaxID=137545 RepID=UPI00217ACE84|nr:phage tail protein [Serratia quinivorans]CAI1157211.1 Uncharacterised protein [Serratia quinivorans]
MATGLILTAVGAEAIETAYQAGEVVTIPIVAFGDGGGASVTPDPAVTKLVNKFGDVPFTQGESGSGMIAGQAVINARDYPGKVVREFGLMSSAGVLIAYGAYPDTYLPEQNDSIVKELVVSFAMPLVHAESVVLEIDPNVSVLTIEEADARYLFRKGDTATGDLGAPMFQANGTSGVPEGFGMYKDQLNNHAPFYSPDYQWPVNSGGAYVPLVKGRGTRKAKGWPTAVSFGYLMPGVDMHAHPVIHAIGDSDQECIWEFDTQTGGLRSKAGTFAIEEQQPIVPLPYSGDSPPLGYVFLLGQAFDKNAYQRTAQAFPSGVFPDMRGRTILGKPDDRWPLTLADGDVKSHGHGGEVGAADLGSKETTQAGAFQPRLRSYNSNTSLDGGWSTRHTVEQDRDYGDRNLNMIEPIPNHSHWVDIGWHGHTLRIDMTGGAKNTVDNIAFNYIVRLA